MNRRNFIRLSAAAAGAGVAAGSLGSLGTLTSCGSTAGRKKTRSGRMKLSFKPIMLQMKHVFNISGFSSSERPSVLVEITYDGITGYGEGGLPPYLIGQNHETVQQFLSKIDLEQFSDPFQLDDILTYVDNIAPGFTSPKSAVDIALHDLIGKLLDVPTWQMFGYTAEKAPDTAYTIGIDTEEMIRKKMLETEPYNIIKVKLGAPDIEADKMLINTVRSMTDKPIVADANMGWKNKHLALEMIHWIAERGALMIEQPLPVNVFDDMAWITERSPIPTYGDESCQRLQDVPRLQGIFHGINIKLIKCTGLYEARKMISTAEAVGMKVMLGCTTETSCGISAAAQVTPKVDFADVDGNLLISNDMFDGIKIVDGKIILNNRPGIGAIPL